MPAAGTCSLFTMQSSSSADRGFFQKPPVLVNQFHDDVSYRRCFQREWTQTSFSLETYCPEHY